MYVHCLNSHLREFDHITGIYFYFVLSEELESLLDVRAIPSQLHISIIQR